MYIFDIIGRIRDRGYPVDDYIAALTQALEWETSHDEYEKALFEISGSGIRSEFPLQAKLLFAYVVNEAIRSHMLSDGEFLNTLEILATAQTRVNLYFDIFPSKRPPNTFVKWHTIGHVELQQMRKQRVETYVRPPSKQDRAIDMVLQNPTATSRQLQQMFRDELGLTANGAATYIYNVRKILKARKQDATLVTAG